MNAIRLRVLLLLRIALASGLGLMAARIWGWPMGLLAAGLGAWGWTLLVLPVFLGLRRAATPAGQAGPGWRQCVQAALHEWWAFERVFSSRQILRLTQPSDLQEVSSGGRRGVLLLHGFRCNRGLWKPWMRVLSSRGHPFIALTMEPANGSIDAYAEQIEQALQALQSASGQPPLVLAHSMGGLAIRAWRRAYAADAARVHRVITLGSPHAGTVMARYARPLNARQMRVGSDWLRELAASEAASWRQRFICVYSLCDQVVCPATLAVLPDARWLEVPACGHLQLVDSPEVRACVLQTLEEGETPG